MAVKYIAVSRLMANKNNISDTNVIGYVIVYINTDTAETTAKAIGTDNLIKFMETNEILNLGLDDKKNIIGTNGSVNRLPVTYLNKKKKITLCKNDISILTVAYTMDRNRYILLDYEGKVVKSTAKSLITRIKEGSLLISNAKLVKNKNSVYLSSISGTFLRVEYEVNTEDDRLTSIYNSLNKTQQEFVKTYLRVTRTNSDLEPIAKWIKESEHRSDAHNTLFLDKLIDYIGEDNFLEFFNTDDIAKMLIEFRHKKISYTNRIIEIASSYILKHCRNATEFFDEYYKRSVNETNDRAKKLRRLFKYAQLPVATKSFLSIFCNNYFNLTMAKNIHGKNKSMSETLMNDLTKSFEKCGYSEFTFEELNKLINVAIVFQNLGSDAGAVAKDFALEVRNKYNKDYDIYFNLAIQAIVLDLIKYVEENQDKKLEDKDLSMFITAQTYIIGILSLFNVDAGGSQMMYRNFPKYKADDKFVLVTLQEDLINHRKAVKEEMRAKMRNITGALLTAVENENNKRIEIEKQKQLAVRIGSLSCFNSLCVNCKNNKCALVNEYYNSNNIEIDDNNVIITCKKSVGYNGAVSLYKYTYREEAQKHIDRGELSCVDKYYNITDDLEFIGKIKEIEYDRYLMRLNEIINDMTDEQENELDFEESLIGEVLLYTDKLLERADSVVKKIGLTVDYKTGFIKELSRDENTNAVGIGDIAGILNRKEEPVDTLGMFRIMYAVTKNNKMYNMLQIPSRGFEALVDITNNYEINNDLKINKVTLDKMRMLLLEMGITMLKSGVYFNIATCTFNDIVDEYKQYYFDPNRKTQIAKNNLVNCISEAIKAAEFLHGDEYNLFKDAAKNSKTILANVLKVDPKLEKSNNYVTVRDLFGKLDKSCIETNMVCLSVYTGLPFGYTVGIKGIKSLKLYISLLKMLRQLREKEYKLDSKYLDTLDIRLANNILKSDVYVVKLWKSLNRTPGMSICTDSSTEMNYYIDIILRRASMDIIINLFDSGIQLDFVNNEVVLKEKQ